MSSRFSCFIVTHERNGARYANGFVIPNHYGQSLEVYKKLADYAKSCFPGLGDDDIECRFVLKSNWCKNHPVISFSLPPDASHADFTTVDYKSIDFQCT